MQSQSDINEAVSSELRTEMRLRSISQRELAGRIGWAQSQLSKRLSGVVPWRADEVERIARVLDIPVSQLMSPRALAG